MGHTEAIIPGGISPHSDVGHSPIFRNIQGTLLFGSCGIGATIIGIGLGILTEPDVEIRVPASDSPCMTASNNVPGATGNGP